MTTSEPLNKAGPSYANMHKDVFNHSNILCIYVAVNTSKLFSVQQKYIFLQGFAFFLSRILWFAVSQMIYRKCSSRVGPA